jgi:hypothetical protein
MNDTPNTFQNRQLLLVPWVGFLFIVLVLAGPGCGKKEEKKVTAPTPTTTTSTPEAVENDTDVTGTTDLDKKIEHALFLLGDQNRESRENGANQIKAIGDPALERLMSYLDANARWVMDWAFNMDAEQLREKWETPVPMLVDFYMKHHYVLPEDLTGDAAQGVKNKVAILNDIGNEVSPNPLFRALGSTVTNIAVDVIYIELKENTEGIIIADNFLVIGTCEIKATSEQVSFRVIMAGDGSHPFETVVNR